MPVFTPKVMTALEKGVHQLAARFFTSTSLQLTPDEFVLAFVNPDHVEHLRTTQELVGMVGTSTTNASILMTSDGKRMDVSMSSVSTPPIIVPNYVRSGLQPTCPEPLHDRITAWVDDRYRFGCMFGDAVDALLDLNHKCGDARAMAVLLPALPSIMGASSSDPDDALVKRGRKLTDLKGCGSLPALPPEVRQRLQEISALINGATLIDNATESTVGNTYVAATAMRDHLRANMFDAPVDGGKPHRISRFC